MDKLKELAQKYNILIVDDDETARVLIANLLKNMFKEVYEAENGKVALEKIKNNKIDLVISDINMPVMDGIEFINELKKNSDIPVVVLTAHNKNENLAAFIKLKVDGFLLKPLDIEQLLTTLTKILKNIKLKKEKDEFLCKMSQYLEALNEKAIVSKTDLKGNITYVNNIFEKISQYSKNELMRKPHNIIRHPDTPKEVFKELWNTIQSGKTWKGKIKNKKKDGSAYYVDVIIKPIFDLDGNIVEYYAIRYDITENVNINKRIKDLISLMKNPLVSIVKINNFCDIEQIYGLEVAERISDEFIDILKQKIKNYINFEHFFTLNFGEYVLIKEFNEENIENLEIFVKEIQKMFINIENDFLYDISIKLSISNTKNAFEDCKIGIDTLEKENNMFLIANNLFEKEKETSRKNLSILKKVHTAIDNNQIVSFFQPIVDVNANIIKYESLVRLKDNENYISPFFFLELSKKVGYYPAITKAVIKNSFEALKLVNNDISINLSIFDILNEEINDFIISMLEKNKNDAKRVTFELLEEENDANIKIIVEFIEKIKEYRVSIAIDDFGSGYSNYKRIFTYHPDILKIDGSLIKDIENDRYSLSIVKSIVNFAKENNLKTVAEFVENETIFNILQQIGVDYMQGYFFGKPQILR